MPIITSGSLNPTSAIVPDLYVVIVPPSTLLLNGVASNVVGLVGTASWGPVSQPVSVSTMANYSQLFGPLVNRKYDMGTHAAIISQQAGSAMQCVRVTDGTEVAAAKAVGSTNITFTAAHTGSFGNNITVTIQTGAQANTIAAVVGVPGYAAELFNNIASPSSQTSAVASATTTSATVTVASTVGITTGMTVTGTGISNGPITVSNVNVDGITLTLSSSQSLAKDTVLTFTPSYHATWVALAAAINNGQNALRTASNWITATAGSGTTAPSAGTTYTLIGGTDGATTITGTTLVGTQGPDTGMYCLGSLGVSFIDLADMDDSTEFTAVDSFALQESSYAIQTLPAGTSVSSAVSTKRTSGLDSYSSKLLMGDWLWWNDPVNQVTRLVSPQAFVAGRLSNLTPQLTSLNKTIFGIAGSQKSGVGGVNQAVYSTADLSTLIQAGIDVVTNPGAGGLNIWTCRSGHNSSTNITVHLDSYPTLTNYIAKTLAAGMGFYIGQTITPRLFQLISTTLTQFMQNLTGAGFLAAPDGSIPYAVQCNAANNPDLQTKIGIVTATVQAEYPAINETFIVNLQGGSTITVSRQV